MSTSSPLPPSERDLQVYESVCLTGRSLRDAASEHQLSVTRIRQIVSRVLAWLARTLPLETDATRQQQLQLARHLAADQLQYARCELMDLWRQTQDPAYLLKTTRLTLAAARLGVVAGAIDGLLADAWETADHSPPATPEPPAATLPNLLSTARPAPVPAPQPAPTSFAPPPSPPVSPPSRDCALEREPAPFSSSLSTAPPLLTALYATPSAPSTAREAFLNVLRATPCALKTSAEQSTDQSNGQPASQPAAAGAR